MRWSGVLGLLMISTSAWAADVSPSVVVGSSGVGYKQYLMCSAQTSTAAPCTISSNTPVVDLYAAGYTSSVVVTLDGNASTGTYTCGLYTNTAGSTSTTADRTLIGTITDAGETSSYVGIWRKLFVHCTTCTGCSATVHLIVVPQ